MDTTTEEIRGALAKELGIPSRVLRQDVVELAWHWAPFVASLGYCPRLKALDMLHVLVLAYLRGRNVRLGTRSALERNGHKGGTLMVLVLKAVYDDQGLSADVRKLGFADFTTVTNTLTQWIQESNPDTPAQDAREAA